MRTIVHLDADAFFASVEQAANARLRGKPIAVGGERRGIIASASYEARKFGVYTPMPTARARKLCPRLIVLPGDYERYEQFSHWMFGYAYDFTPDVEQTSIDEGYFDLTANRRKRPDEIALIIRRAIRQSLKISVSEGIGANKLVSQIASKLNKPAAFTLVPPGDEISFLHPLPNRWLPGIGPKTAARLNSAGLAKIRHIAATPVDLLELLLGGQAYEMRSFANGIDERPLIPAREPQKTFSQQETFAQDQTDEEYLHAVLRRMADRLFAKVRAEGKSVRTLTVKARYNDMAEDQCSESLREPTDLETDVYGRLHTMLRQAWKRRVSLRLVSLKLSNVYDGLIRTELALDRGAEQQEARERLARVVDELRRIKGTTVLLRGHDFVLKEVERETSNIEHSTPNAEGSVEAKAFEVGGPMLDVRCSSDPRAFPISMNRPTPDPSKEGNCPPNAAPLLGGDGGGFMGTRRESFRRNLTPALSRRERENRSPSSGTSRDGDKHNDSRVNKSGRLLSPLPGGEGQGEGEGRLATGPLHKLRLVVSIPKPTSFVPLRVHSYYSFLDSTLSPKDMVRLAQWHGCPAVALMDTGNLHGAAEFAEAAMAAGIKPIFGAELRAGTHPLLLYVQNAHGYANLCRLLSASSYNRPRPSSSSSTSESVADFHRRSFDRQHLAGFTDGLIAVSSDVTLANLFPGRFYQLATKNGDKGPFPIVACPAIRYATPHDRLQFDIVQSIRTRTLLRQTHPEKHLGGKFHFRTPTEMLAGCQQHPDWLAHAREIADRCEFEFPFGKPQFPAFATPDGSSSCEFLRRLVLEGFHRRYHGRHIVSDTGATVPLAQVQAQIETELSIIAEVGYEDLFLSTWDLLQACRERGIEWITRGSAADSLVCYCLGISDVCPVRYGLYFRRFLNKERMALHKLPDIDVDFPHDRKDDVVNLLFAKYGPEHCAVVGGFSTFQARSAVGDVAKVLGVSEFQIRRFTEHFPWSFGGGWIPVDEVRLRGAELIKQLRSSPECRDLPLDEEPFKTAVETAAFLDGFPRHPKMHPCGVVLSRQPMHELTPTFISNKGWPTTHLDMDAVEAVGLVKMDVLAQGGLAVMRDVQAALARRGVEVDLKRCVVAERKLAGEQVKKWESEKSSLSHLPTFPPASPNRLLASAATDEWFDNPEVWEMIASGGARAVHHIESPAMTSLCRMTNVREIDGLIAIVSVIRPGAANEQKKVKFTRRYQKMELPEYPHPSLEACLRSTFGLVVYEEHILQICEAFAGLNPGRADVLRRALVKQNRRAVEEIAREFAASAQARGHAPEKIKEVWELVAGFNGYAFCKAHSTAYGVEAYQAAWLKRYFPAEFMAAVLTNGKGFYHPLVYVLECHRLGLKLLPPSVNQPGPMFAVVNGCPPGLRALALTPALSPRERENRPPAHDKLSNGEKLNDCGVKKSSQLPSPLPAGEGQGEGEVCLATGDSEPISIKAISNIESQSEALASDVQRSEFDVRCFSASAIRVPLTHAKGLTQRTIDRLLVERARAPFVSLADFYRRVAPQPDEAEIMTRVGAFDEFGHSHTAQFWELQQLHRAYGQTIGGQGWLLTAPGLDKLPQVPLVEPTRRQRLQWETDCYEFAVSGHPLELYDDVAWETYCPVARLAEHVGEEIVTCGLIVEQRTHHQITGEPMKFLTLTDWTGMVETELFAATYRTYGLATVRYPVLEVTARVEPFDNGRGFSLRVLRAGKPRSQAPAHARAE